MGKVIVVKVGGSVLENLDPGFFAGCARMQKTEGLSLVIVHGGGPFISRWMERIGKKPAFVDGRRVTDGETLTIAEMALAGQVNKELVSRFAREGVAVLGLSGVDLNLLQVEPEDPKLGYVGKVTAVHAERLQTILQQGWLPVIASLGIDGQGKVLNVNADEAAGAIARALGRNNWSWSAMWMASTSKTLCFPYESGDDRNLYCPRCDYGGHDPQSALGRSLSGGECQGSEDCQRQKSRHI